MAQRAANARSSLLQSIAVDFSRPLPWAGGGLPAYEARGASFSGIAVETRAGWAARATMLTSVAAEPIEGVARPLGHVVAAGPDGQDRLLILHEPYGPAPLDPGSGGWTERALFDQVLRPVALALHRLAERGMTHRAVRPANLFRAGGGGPLLLGPAWTAPPASLQPACYEPPYSAQCLPCGRGDGTIADDVYALGVTVLALACGAEPFAGLDDRAIIRRKLAHGSLAALASDRRLPPALMELLRGMLAEDPDHRPSPASLADARGAARRVPVRATRRAQRPLELDGAPVWDVRSLAHALAGDPAGGAAALRDGRIGFWLRRGLGDGLLAARLEQIRPAQSGPEHARPEHARPEDGDPEHAEASGDVEAAAIMRAVALLDPLAPLCWRGIALWPDGIGTALAATEGDGRVTGLLLGDAVTLWTAIRVENGAVPVTGAEIRRFRTLLRVSGGKGAEARLRYAANALLPCRSPALGPRLALDGPGLLRALEEAAGQGARQDGPIDAEIAAFIAARLDGGLDTELAALAPGRGGDAALAEAARAQLAVLARLQARAGSQALPALGRRLAGSANALVAGWRSPARRAALRGRLAELGEAGKLIEMFALLEDGQARLRDMQEARAASQRVAELDAALAELGAGGPARARRAERLGQEIASGIGVAALACALTLAALG